MRTRSITRIPAVFLILGLILPGPLPAAAEPAARAALRVSQPHDNSTASGLEESLAAGMEESPSRPSIENLLSGRHLLSEFLLSSEAQEAGRISPFRRDKLGKEKMAALVKKLVQRSRSYDKKGPALDRLPRLPRVMVRYARRPLSKTDTSFPTVSEEELREFARRFWDPAGKGGIPADRRRHLQGHLHRIPLVWPARGMKTSEKDFAQAFSDLEVCVRALRGYRQLCQEILGLQQKGPGEPAAPGKTSARISKRQNDQTLIASEWRTLSLHALRKLVETAGENFPIGPKNKVRILVRLTDEIRENAGQVLLDLLKDPRPTTAAELLHAIEQDPNAGVLAVCTTPELLFLHVSWVRKDGGAQSEADLRRRINSLRDFERDLKADSPPPWFSAGLEETAATALKLALEAQQHPGGPAQMLVDAFNLADVVVLSDPPSLEVHSIQQPEYSAFLGGLVERLETEAGLDQIFIQLHPQVVEDLVMFVRRWRKSGIPDLWSFLNLYPDSVSLTHFVAGSLPSHWLDLFRVAAERRIPIIGIDPGEGFVDHRNRQIGDPKLQVFDEETARVMRDRVFSERRGKALVIVDPHQAAGTPGLGRFGRLLKEQPGLNVVTVWVGVGEEFVTGNYDLHDTGLPVIAAADTTQSPIAEFTLYPDLFSSERERDEAPVPVLASHFDRLVYFQSVRDIPVPPSAPRAKERAGIRLSDLTFDEAMAIVRQQAPRAFILHGSLEKNAEALDLADGDRAAEAFEEEAKILFDGNPRGQLYDISFPDCVIVGHPAGLVNSYAVWSEPRTAAVFPEPRPVPPSPEEPVWQQGWGFWPKAGDDLDPTVATGAGALRIFFTVSSLAVPPGLGSDLPWVEGGDDLFTKEVKNGLSGLYLDGKEVSPRASRYIRQMLAAEGPAAVEARFTPPSRNGAPARQEALPMVPIHVTRKTGRDGSRYLEVRYEGRVPTKARYGGWYPFTAHFLQAGRWSRVKGEGQIQIQPGPVAEAPAGQAQQFESVDAFLEEYWLELAKQNLVSQAQTYREQAGRVLVFPRRAVESGSVVHLLVQASPEARQTWSDVLAGRLRPDKHQDLNVDVKVAPYPEDGNLPQGELSVVIRETGVLLPAPPTPAAPVVLISNVGDLGNVNAAWLCAVAVNEALRGLEIGPVLFVLPFRVGEEEYYAVMA